MNRKGTSSTKRKLREEIDEDEYPDPKRTKRSKKLRSLSYVDDHRKKHTVKLTKKVLPFVLLNEWDGKLAELADVFSGAKPYQNVIDEYKDYIQQCEPGKVITMQQLLNLDDQDTYLTALRNLEHVVFPGASMVVSASFLYLQNQNGSWINPYRMEDKEQNEHKQIVEGLDFMDVPYGPNRTRRYVQFVVDKCIESIYVLPNVKCHLLHGNVSPNRANAKEEKKKEKEKVAARIRIFVQCEPDNPYRNNGIITGYHGFYNIHPLWLEDPYCDYYSIARQTTIWNMAQETANLRLFLLDKVWFQDQFNRDIMGPLWQYAHLIADSQHRMKQEQGRFKVFFLCIEMLINRFIKGQYKGPWVKFFNSGNLEYGLMRHVRQFLVGGGGPGPSSTPSTQLAPLTTPSPIVLANQDDEKQTIFNLLIN